MSLRRLKAEERYYSLSDGFIFYHVSDAHTHTWSATIFGPKDSPYAGVCVGMAVCTRERVAVCCAVCTLSLSRRLVYDNR